MGACPSVDLFYKHIYHLLNILAGKGFVYSMTYNILAPNYSETHIVLAHPSRKNWKAYFVWEVIGLNCTYAESTVCMEHEAVF